MLCGVIVYISWLKDRGGIKVNKIYIKDDL